MFHNDVWERENQDLLKEWYLEQKAINIYANGPVRRIICAGCGKVFYTRISTKKYCNYYTCGTIGNYKLQKQHRLDKRKDTVCAECGKLFTPKRSDAKYCCNACRQKAYRKNVTTTPSTQNEYLA